MSYVPLRIHTEHSLRGGTCRIEALVERARTLGLGAIGITDQDTTSGWLALEHAARDAGIRPIFGASVRLRPEVDGAWEGEDVRIALLARDRHGLRNLNRLLGHLYVEAGDEGPAATLQDLSRFAGGVLALDGGWNGPVTRSLQHGVAAAAARVAGSLREIYGADGFYMESLSSRNGEEDLLQAAALQLARRLNVPVVATPDVRYLEPADAEAYAIRSGTLHAPASGRASHLPGDAEVLHAHRDFPEALANTWVVAEKCQAPLDLRPDWEAAFRPASGRTPRAELRHVCERAACERYAAAHYEDLPVAVRDRLAHELAMIEEKELASCFLIVQDVVRYAREEGISVGPGCGAAAGSLVCFVLGISGVDPLANGLYFERFLRPQDAAPPEFVLQVEHARRAQWIEAIPRRLGVERVGYRGEAAPMALPSLVREVGAAQGAEPESIEALARILAQRPQATLRQLLDECTELQQIYQEKPSVRRLLEVADRLEGLPHHPTLQAGGLLVAPATLYDIATVERAANGDPLVRLAPECASRSGFLGIEVRGERSLTLLHEARRIAGLGVREETCAATDAMAFAMLQRGETAGILDLDTPAMRFLLRRVQPNDAASLVATMALSRQPGAARVERFLAHRNGLAATGAVEPQLAAILDETHGFLLYPEQVLQLCIEYAGLAAHEADGVVQAIQRRAVGDMARGRARFVQGAVELGHALEDAEKVFESVLHFRDFDCSKAAAVAEAQLALETARLRVQHPLALLSAALNAARGRDAQVRRLLADAAARHLEVADVHVNTSTAACTLRGEAVQLGLDLAGALSLEDVESILRARQSRPFASVADLVARTRLPRRSLEALLRVGACEGLDSGTSKQETMSRHAADAGAGESLQLDFGFDIDAARVIEETHEPVGVGGDMSAAEQSAAAPGCFWQQQPLVRWGRLWADARVLEAPLVSALPGRTRLRVAGMLRDVHEVQTRQGETMAFATVEDLFGSCNVVLFPSVLAAVSRLGGAASAEPLVFDGVSQQRYGRTRLVVERVRSAAEVVESQLELFAPALAPVVSLARGRRGGSQQPNAERRADRPEQPALGGKRAAGGSARRGPQGRSGGRGAPRRDRRSG